MGLPQQGCARSTSRLRPWRSLAAPRGILSTGALPTQETYLETLSTKAVPLMLEAGIDVYLNLQLGLPGDTSGDREQTISALAELGAIGILGWQDVPLRS